MALAFGALFGFRQMTRTFTAGGTGAAQVWSTPLFPGSKAYTSVDIANTWTTAATGAKSTAIDLKLTLKDLTTWTLKYDPVARTYTVEDPSSATVVPATPIAKGVPSAALFTAAGLDTTDATIAAEVAELDQVVSILVMSPFTQPSTMTLTQFVAGTPTFPNMAGIMAAPSVSDWLPGAIAIGVLAVIWLLGIWGIVVRRRRVLARCAQGSGSGSDQLAVSQIP